MPLYFRDDRAALFIHVPKCGGSSVETAMRAHATYAALFNPGGKPMLCSPQHFHRELLDIVLESRDIPSFAVVRHPMLRAISVYLHRTRNRQDNPLSMPTFFRRQFSGYLLAPYRKDNHVRPQYQYLLPDTVVFRLEDGLEPALKHGLSLLGGDTDSDLKRVVRKSRSHEAHLSHKTLTKIEEFYSDDYDIFGYERIANQFLEGATLTQLKGAVSSPQEAIQPNFSLVELAWEQFRERTKQAEERAAKQPPQWTKFKRAVRKAGATVQRAVIDRKKTSD